MKSLTMANNTTMIRSGDIVGSDDGPTGNQPGGPSGGPPCGPPPGWTGPPPQGGYANAAEWLWKIIPPIIIIFGTVGNMLTIIILFRHMRKLSSTAIFLLTLALSDTLFLLNAPLRRWIIAEWDKDVRHISETGCKFSVYLTYSSIQLSSWILVSVTIERFICIVWPHRVRLGCTRKSSAVVISILVLIIFGSNTHIFYGFGHSKLPIFYNQGFCEPLYEGYRLFWSKSYSWIDFVVVFVAPFGILLAANTIIIFRLRKTRKTRRKLSIVRTQSDRSYATDTRVVTIMLILLSVVFFVCLTPVSIYFIYRPYWLESIEKWICIDVYEYIREHEKNKLVFALTNLIGYINSAFNFVLYIFSGSKYRSELKALLLCRPVGKEGLFGSSTSGPRRRGTTSTIASFSRQGSMISFDGNVNGVDPDPSGSSGEKKISKLIKGGGYDLEQVQKDISLENEIQSPENTDSDWCRL